jgi:hypothetical protein
MYGLSETHMGHMDRNEYFHLFWRMMHTNQQDISFEGFTKGFKGSWEHIFAIYICYWPNWDLHHEFLK